MNDARTRWLVMHVDQGHGVSKREGFDACSCGAVFIKGTISASEFVIGNVRPRLDHDHSCVWRDYCREHDAISKMHVEKLRRARARTQEREQELAAALSQLDEARKVIENAQSWADRWRAHAFNMKSTRNMLLHALKEMTEDLVARWDMNDASTNPGIKHCVEQARKALTAVEKERR